MFLFEEEHIHDEIENFQVRTRIWRRKKNYSKAIRKKNLARSFYGRYDYYPYIGKYIKNKIHCSCWMCASKIKNHGNKPSELRKIGKKRRVRNNFSQILREHSV